MTYEQYRERGHYYADYCALSQWQRLRGLAQDWWRSNASDKHVRFASLWAADDLENDWLRVSDWWHPRQWWQWRWGLDQCQNFHRLNLGPTTVLFAT